MLHFLSLQSSLSCLLFLFFIPHISIRRKEEKNGRRGEIEREKMMKKMKCYLVIEVYYLITWKRKNKW